MSRARRILTDIAAKYALPAVYCIVIIRLIIDVFMPNDVSRYTIICFAAECLLFVLFEWLKGRKVLRGLIYMTMLIGITVLYFRLIMQGYTLTMISYQDWFYVDINEVGQVDEYFTGTMIFMTFFLSSVVYYFTLIRYRASGTLLAMLFPLFIYAKRAESIETFELTLMITVFLALMVHSRLVSTENKERVVINRQYAAALALFVAVVGAVTMFLPSTTAKSKLEADKTYFDLTGSRNSNYSDLSDLSSLRFGSNDEGVELFRMTASDNYYVYYLRRQGFDSVTEDERWVMSRDNSIYDIIGMNYADNEINTPVYMYQMMRELAESGDYEQYGLKKELYPQSIYTQTEEMSLYASDNFAPSYLPVPITLEGDSLKQYNKIPHGEVYAAALYDNGSAPELDTDIEFYPENDEARAYISKINIRYEDFEAALEAAAAKGDIRNSVVYNVQAIHDNFTDLSGYEASDRLRELAQSITGDKDTEYEKAQAIVDYFENNGFRYDKEYVPEDESIDYFLFESKRGSCTSYATSMTLIARLAGLPARYVEGFAAYEKNDSNEYIIRDSNAHAWVEIYISGVGWVTFDPTIADYQTAGGDDDGGFDFTIFFEYFGRIAIVLGVIFVIIFVILLDRIIELLFRISLMFTDNTNRVLKLYRRTLKLLENSSGVRLAGYTPHELLGFMRSRREADLSYVVELFEAVCFGGYTPSDEEWKKAYGLYKGEYKKLRKQKPLNTAKA